MRKFIILALILSNFGCGIYAKNSYDSNFESYNFEDIVVYISYNSPEVMSRNVGAMSAYNLKCYKLFYDETINSLNAKGYKTARLSDIDISKMGYFAKINLSNYPLTEIPNEFSYSDSSLDLLFKNHKTVMLVAVMPRYSTSANDFNKFYLDGCAIKYFLLDSNSHKIIATGPSTHLNSPGKSYQRSRSGIIDSSTTSKAIPYDPQKRTIGTEYTTTTKFIGYNQSDEEFIKGIASSLFSQLPALKK
jgi:hypothetical protein